MSQKTLLEEEDVKNFHVTVHRLTFFFPVQGNMGALGYNLCYTGWNGIFVGYEM